ncbi:MAG: Hsp70 family protein [Deltaproteobacteria bacterium]|nr:Hsp70 family protein [Deltaproteobacteria bacterium]MBK8239175.1 Hsp70 family protein [Deltaproteobacteria bacterium]MBP7288633.1 Hsp70 family protein [Nannocystaceae bacterium]
MSAESEPVLGIDLGTTNSACAVVRGGRASVVRRGDDRIIPSVVAAMPDGRIIVGNRAKQRRAVDPTQVVFSAKRMIGRRFGSPEVQRMRETMPYRIVEGPNEGVAIELGGQLLSPVEIAAHILKYLREMAEEALQQPVSKAVIAVPANFTDAQRSATRIAARLANLDVIRVINEPTAAALAYGYIEDTDRRIAVYDFGGGTFDVTILQITRNVFEVLATSGEMFLGGDDIDEAVLSLMAQAFERQHGISLAGKTVAMERLRVMAEQVKIELSENYRSGIRIDDVYEGRGLEFALSEADLRWHIEPIVRRTVPVCADALRVAGLVPQLIDEIVLVGGTTRLPLVREIVAQVFGKPAQTSINPMSVVAVGAAIQGAALLGSLVPMAQAQASGGAQAHTQASAVLLDVTPRTLGVRTLGGFVDVVIPRNTAIPVEQTRLFTTTTDNQRFVRIQVCQGEAEDFDANHKLGELTLAGLRDAPRGEVTVAVTFEINADGLIEVRAIDQDTGARQSATMRVLGGLEEQDLQAAAQRLHASSDGGAVARSGDTVIPR